MWHQKPEWLAFCSAVVKRPHDQTARLVAADWLDDQDDPRAAKRAELIRVQHGKPDGLQLERDKFAECGFPELELSGAAGLLVAEGWPVWAVFEPHRFCAEVVAPVFRVAPLTTCTTIGLCADVVQVVGNRTVFEFSRGPQTDALGNSEVSVMGFPLAGEVAPPILPVSFIQAGRLPHAAYQFLPGRFIKKNRYGMLGEAVRAAHRVLWRCGRKWAQLSQNAPGSSRAPYPHPRAQLLFHWLTMRPSNLPRPVPSAADPWSAAALSWLFPAGEVAGAKYSLPNPSGLPLMQILDEANEPK